MSHIQNGVGPHDMPWPVGNRYDASLLAEGDSRNVIEKYRYWTVDAIKADLDKSRQPLEVAIENVSRDFNMGTIVRNANAFNISRVHVIGSRQWNKRGAMATDKYVHMVHYATPDDFIEVTNNKTLIAVDNVVGSVNLHNARLPKNAVLLFGAEGPGISAELLQKAHMVVAIEQFGSTRSINVGVAAGIAMYAWLQQNLLQ